MEKSSSNFISTISETSNKQDVALAEREAILRKLQQEYYNGCRLARMTSVRSEKDELEIQKKRKIKSEALQRIKSSCQKADVTCDLLKAATSIKKENDTAMFDTKKSCDESAINATRDLVKLQEDLKEDKIKDQKEVYKQAAKSSDARKEKYQKDLIKISSTSVHPMYHGMSDFRGLGYCEGLAKKQADLHNSINKAQNTIRQLDCQISKYVPILEENSYLV